jgi:hypothetical protein
MAAAGVQHRETTGTENKTYNLVSVLYHALKGAVITQQYKEDAEREGDRELAQFFQRDIEQKRSLAEEVKRLLKSRI